MRMQSLALALAAIALAAPAAAAEEKSVGVRYTDLDLTHEAGQRELDIRLERAAREVCGMNETTVGSRIPSARSRDCYREAKRQLDQEFAQLVSRKAAGG